MSQPDHTSGGDAVTSAREGESNSGLLSTATVAEYARRGLQSTVVTGIVGGVFLLQGVRSLRRRHWIRGLGGLLIGGVFIAMAAVQRESDVDLGEAEVGPADVVDTAPDVGDVSSGSATADEAHANGDEASAVVDTAPDVEDAGSGPEIDSDVESTSVDQTDVVDTGSAGSESADDETESAE